MSFECVKCGACCRFAAAISKIPELDRGDGTCSIYDERPIICRVDATYEQFYSDTCSRDEYYRVRTNVVNF